MSGFIAIQTYYSLLHGLHSPHALCKISKQAGYSTVALVDRNNLYGLPHFLSACNEYELRPIIGVELSDIHSSAMVFSHGIQGYAHLCACITESQCLENFVLHTSLLNHADDLVVVTQDTELLHRLNGKLSLYYYINSLKRVPADIQQMHIQPLCFPKIVHPYTHDEDFYHLVSAIALKTSVSLLPDAIRTSTSQHLVPYTEYRNRYAVFSEILHTTEQRIDTLFSYTGFGAPIMPVWHRDARSELRNKVFEGAVRRYGSCTQQVKNRLNYELQIIESKGFEAYFLVVDDIVRQSPRTCGRGSGAASCVSYCLGITNVDPIRYNLMFERFLNEGRTDPPDIDIDFAWDERDSVLEYVFSHYGTDHAALVANHCTFQPRMALREIGRVYGMTESEISTVTKKFPHMYSFIGSEQGIDIEQTLHNHPKSKSLVLDSPWPEIMKACQRLVGIPRMISTHCGGVVITPEPITSYVPLQKSSVKNYPLIAWEKEGAEHMGLVKIDLLGNRSLAVIRDALGYIKDMGNEVNERVWQPADDHATQELLAHGRSMGVFYVESPAMRLLQKKSGFGDFDHLVIHSSIIRPAANKCISEYLKRLKGASYTAEHPCLTEILKETYGIMVYQEDVVKVAMAVAGFSLIEADGLRKILSKKDRVRTLESYREKFFSQGRANNASSEALQKLWQMILSFSGYSFCKPHSASYVQVSMQSAYLKAHFPAAFMASVLSNYGGYYTTQAYISEAQRLGLCIAGPDVNHSMWRYHVEDQSIRVGLCQVKGLSLQGAMHLVDDRQKNGLYENVRDFFTRSSLSQHDCITLVSAGACDSLEPDLTRSQLFWLIRTFFRSNLSSIREPAAPQPVPQLNPYESSKLLAAQYRSLGFLIDRHPITLVNRTICSEAIAINTIHLHIGKHVTFYGWCVTSKTVLTSDSQLMQFVTFEDETDICETVFFPDVYEKYVRYLMIKEAFLIRGKVGEEFGALSIEVTSLSPLL